MTDDELLKRLDEPVGDGHSYRAVVINGQQYNPLHVAAAARILKLKAELAFYKGFYDSVYKHGTHVIVSVEPTEEMADAGGEQLLKHPGKWPETAAAIYRAMIRAAQPERQQGE